MPVFGPLYFNHLKVIFSQTNCVKDSWFRAQKDLGYQGDGVQITQLIGK